MIAKIFLNLTDYPFFRRLVWKPIYEVLAKNFKIKDWHFMNYGYAPSEYEKFLRLEEKDEINRYPLQLYHYLASKIKMEGLDVLEIGSGRGGGCSYLKRYLNPRKVTGMDIAGNAVQFSKKTHQQKGLYFKQGNAEALPFEDEYFDVVINVESCHAYGSVPKFLSEVNRVLCEGGYFLCTDLRSPNGMKTLRENLSNSGLALLDEENITENVIKAIEAEEAIKQARIQKHVPKWFQNIFREFAGVKNSKIHTDLKNGDLIYHRFTLKKTS
ncbi:MAG TPA: class I SAM-dependent methyltransferase [Chitinophagaceae bacterium]|jgi:ubiquinone/menaquinone biosynthesis C-methylase UbiE|nr:class I SAM-dependent methyltransferase [Chitinophagaceae bacterium]